MCQALIRGIDPTTQVEKQSSRRQIYEIQLQCHVANAVMEECPEFQSPSWRGDGTCCRRQAFGVRA